MISKQIPGPVTGAGASAPNTPASSASSSNHNGIALVSPVVVPTQQQQQRQEQAEAEAMLEVEAVESVRAEERAGREGRGWCFPFQVSAVGVVCVGGRGWGGGRLSAYMYM